MMSNAPDDMHSGPPPDVNRDGGSSLSNTSLASKPKASKAHQLSFRTASINKNLAKRLNNKKVECRELRDANTKLHVKLVQYKRYILDLIRQKEKLQNVLLNVNDELNARMMKSNNLLQRALEEVQKMENARASIEQIFGNENVENDSYLGNLSLINAMNQRANLIPKKQPLSMKNRKKAVNMVRPMKYGFVVGNPVVSLRRLRRVVVPTSPLEVVTEDVEMDVVEEDDNLNDTVIEVAPTPSGLPSPSSPEAASTSATPEPASQTSPDVEPRPSTSRRTQSTSRDQQQMFQAEETTSNGSEDHRGPPPHMPYYLECLIAHCCKEAVDDGHVISYSDVQRVLAVVMNHKSYRHLIKPFKNGAPSRAWVAGFILRHPELKRNNYCSRDSIKSKMPGPKGKKRKSLQVETAVARSLLIEKQRKNSPPSSKVDRRNTYVVPPRRSTNVPSSSPGSSTMTISKTQQIQLMTPCRVVVENLGNSPKCVQTLRTSPPSLSLSPRSPVVLLDRITTRKKIRNQNQTSDCEDQDVEISGEEDIKIENETLDMTLTDVKEEAVSPLVRVTSDESRYFVPLARSSVARDSLQQDGMETTLSTSPPLRVKMGFPKKMSRNVSNILPPIEENEDKSLTVKSISPRKSEEIPELRARSPSKLPPKSKTSSEKSDDSEPEKPQNYDSDPDYIPEEEEEEEVVVVVKPKPALPKKNKAMPLCKKLLLRKQLGNETSDEDEKTQKKKMAYENKDGKPDTDRNDSDSSIHSNSTPVKNNSADSDASYLSYDSGGSMSPAERKQYMSEFFSRVGTEDPLEGTSRRCEPKKKSVVSNQVPSKKSLRQLKKKTYVESPDTPQGAKDSDESWRPAKKQNRLKKKNAKKQ